MNDKTVGAKDKDRNPMDSLNGLWSVRVRASRGTSS